MNSLVYRTLFYLNIYGSYKLSKNSPVFLAHPVYIDTNVLWWKSKIPANIIINPKIERFLLVAVVHNSTRFHECHLYTFHLILQLDTKMNRHWLLYVLVRLINFYSASIYARVVLGVVILSVRPSVTRVDCDKTKWCTADILIPHERAITLLLYDTSSGWWATPHSLLNLHLKWPTTFKKCWLRQISAYKVSAVRDSEKKFNYDEYKVDHGLSNEL